MPEEDEEPAREASPLPIMAAGVVVFLLGGALVAWSFMGGDGGSTQDVELAASATRADEGARAGTPTAEDGSKGDESSQGREDTVVDEPAGDDPEGGSPGRAAEVESEGEAKGEVKDEAVDVNPADPVSPAATTSPRKATKKPRVGKPIEDEASGSKPPAKALVEPEPEVETPSDEPPAAPPEDTPAKTDVVPEPSTPELKTEPEPEPEPKVTPPVAKTEPAVGATTKDDGDAKPEPKVRRVIRKKVIKKKKAKVPLSF